MKVAFAQLILILVLAGIAGTGYNLWLSSTSPEKHLDWVNKRYEGFDFLGSKAGEGGAAPARGGEAPARASLTIQPPGSPTIQPRASPTTPEGGTGPAAKAPAPKAAAGDSKAAPKSGTGAEAVKVTKAAAPATAPLPGEEPAGAGDFLLIALDAASEEYRAGTLFLDARRSRDYELGHIPGAMPMSAHEGDLLEKIAKLRDEQPLEAPIVIYCTNSKDCEDSKIVGRQLKEVGFLNVSIYLGGFPEWEKEKRPVAKGKEPGRREGA